MSISKHTVISFIKGNQDALAKVYLEFKNLMYFVIASYIDNRDDCDDLLSEAFLKAIENKEKIEDPQKIKSYLCSIAKNCAINFAKGNRPILISDSIEDIYGEEDRTNSILNIIEPLLSNKETIITYYRIGYSYSWEEIHQLTGIPESTARRIFDKAKEKLRKELK